MARTTLRVIARDRIVALEPRLLLAAGPVWTANQPGIGQPAQVAEESPYTLAEIHALTGVDVAHQRGLLGNGQTVVVIDSGIAYDHAALGGGLGFEYRVVGGWDFTEENDADPYDDGPAGFHGTHVAGIIGSSDATHLGVAPEVDLVALRVFNDMGRGKLAWLERSLQWVIAHVNDFEHPITTVNLSLGTDWNSTTLPEYATLEDEFAELHGLGIFVAVAAGNSFDPHVEGLSYPAASPYVIPAASETALGSLSDFSQRTARVIVAPGEQITSTVPDYVEDFNGITDDFYAASGTSMASPYLAGASVLVRQAMQQAGIEQITVDAIRDLLIRTAKEIFDPVTQATYHGLDVAAAIDSLRLPSPPQVLDVGLVSDLGTTLSVGPSHATTAVQFTAEFAGLWSIEGVHADTLDVDGAPVDHSHSGDAVISTGQAEPIRIELSPSDTSREIRISQVVSVRGSRITVRGTPGIDQITVDDLGRIDFNGVEFPFSSNDINRISIEGGQGANRLTVLSHADNALTDFSPGYVHMVAGDLALTGFDFPSIEVYANGSGHSAAFHGSSAADQLHAKPTHSWMKNNEYLNYVRGAQIVSAWSEDALDKAVFYDVDQAVSRDVRPGQARFVGAGYDNRALGFAEVVAYADPTGGRLSQLDTAEVRLAVDENASSLAVIGVGYVTDNAEKDPAGVQRSLRVGTEIGGVLADAQLTTSASRDQQLWTAEVDHAEPAMSSGYGISEVARLVASEARAALVSPLDTAWIGVASDHDSNEEPLALLLLNLDQVIADIGTAGESSE